MERVTCPLADDLARLLRGARTEMTERWLERISQRASIDRVFVFPTKEILDHVPLLMDGIADYIEDPAEEISADDVILAKAMELGELRLAQGFGPHEVLKEYEILGEVLFSFLIRTVDEIDRDCTRGELLACAHRLFRAITVIQQVTTTHYLRLAEQQVREREGRLRSFNRLITHELKNRIAAVGGAATMLREAWIVGDEGQRQRFLSIVAENARGMEVMLDDILLLTRTDPDQRAERHIKLPAVVDEAARQLREMAREREVEIRVARDIPEVEVDSAAVELCLVNYLSNAIKYSDPDKEDRWVEVAGRLAGDATSRELIVQVSDNGIGVPVDRRDELFERFYRAHDGVTWAEGSGLGLSIVRETVSFLGGRAWAEFDREEGSTFNFSLPVPRSTHQDATALEAELLPPG